MIALLLLAVMAIACLVVIACSYAKALKDCKEDLEFCKLESKEAPRILRNVVRAKAREAKDLNDLQISAICFAIEYPEIRRVIEAEKALRREHKRLKELV